MCADRRRKRARVRRRRGGHHRKHEGASQLFCGDASELGGLRRERSSSGTACCASAPSSTACRPTRDPSSARAPSARVVEMVDTDGGAPRTRSPCLVCARSTSTRANRRSSATLRARLSSLPRASTAPDRHERPRRSSAAAARLVFDKLARIVALPRAQGAGRGRGVPLDGDPRGRLQLRQPPTSRAAASRRSNLHASRLAADLLSSPAERPLRRAFRRARARAPAWPRRDADRLWRRRDVGGGPRLVRRPHPAQLRPPAATLGLGWGHEVDCWAMGCILVEL